MNISNSPGNTINFDDTLGSRCPAGISYVQFRKPRENWCDFRQHYVNEEQMPLFETHDFRWKGRRPRYVCYSCMKEYPKDSKYGDYEDNVPDTSEPVYTTGIVNLSYTTGGVEVIRKE